MSQSVEAVAPYQPGEGFAERLKAVRTIGALRREDPGAGAERALARLDEDALAFAAQNPEHSEAGRAAARAALAARLGEAEADARIQRFIDALPPASFLRAADLAAGDSTFFGAGRWFRRVLGWAANIALIVVLVTMFASPPAEDRGFADAVAAGIMTQAEVDEANRQPSDEERAADPNGQSTSVNVKREALRERYPQSAPLFETHRQLSAAGGNAMMWALILFPALTIAIGLRQRPARVLLLRRFNDKAVDAAIAKLSRARLQPYGHVLTLADRYFKRSWLALAFSWFSFNPFLLAWRLINIPIGIVIRIFDRSRAGPIMIWSARDFRNFVRRLTDRYGLNLEVARTRRNAVMVRTSDAWWQHVVVLLMHASDAIVVDVTEVAAGTAWELETMLHEDVESRIVFIARADERADGEASLAAHGFSGAPLHTYERNGRPTDPAAFRAAMRAALQNSHAAQA